MNIFLSFFNMKVCRVFSLESPHRGDSNEYTQHTSFNIKEHHPKYPKYSNVCTAVMVFLLGTQECVRNSHGNRAIGVGATEVLLLLERNCSKRFMVGLDA